MRRSSFDISIVTALIVTNGLVFLMELSGGGDRLITLFALWPWLPISQFGLGEAMPHFQVWQLVTYSFLHGGWAHILLNMYALWLFGMRMEYVWGPKVFAVYYFVCVIGAGLVQLFVSSYSAQQGGIYPTLGASGGVFGILLAFGLTFPEERLMLIFPPVILKAKWLVIIYGGIELFAGVTGTAEGVAHFAHLGGMLFGYLLLRYWRKHPPRFR